MAFFTVRVELHQVPDHSHALYTHLHQEMARRGFSRQIVSDQGGKYQLPSAEYNYQGTANAEAVLTTAQAAIAAIGKTGYVLVSEATRRVWALPPAA